MAYKLKSNEEAILVEGLADLQIAFKAIGVPVDAIKAANRESGKAVMLEAKRQAPDKTGALKRTIRIANVTTHVKIRAGLKRVPYANPIHWGWFYDRENFIYKNIKPNPFMARALGYTRDEVIKTYTEQMAKLIAKYEPPKGRR
jgi:HK97 gp10 family phage protein